MSSSTSDNSDFAGSDELRKEQSFTGLRDYEAAVDRVIGLALGRIRIFDRRLTTSFNQAERIEALGIFLRADRTNRVSIVVHEPDRIRTDCPRLVSLQRQHAHAIQIHRTLTPARGVYDPFCIADGSHYARRFHFDTLRGTLVLNDADGASQLVRRFEEIWEVSQTAVTATTLGL
jgi:hypothetical protein